MYAIRSYYARAGAPIVVLDGGGEGLAERAAHKLRALGYTRIIKLGMRHGDAAPCSIVELTELPAGSFASEGARAESA